MSHYSVPIDNNLVSSIDFYWLRKPGATSADLSSMGSRHAKKVVKLMSHMTHFIDNTLYWVKKGSKWPKYALNSVYYTKNSFFGSVVPGCP